MGNVTLFTEPSGAYYFFTEDILSHIDANQDDEYLYILPVNRAVRYFKKHLLNHCGRPAIIDPPVYTFTTFVRYIFSKTPCAKQIIPASLRLIYINYLLEKHQEEFQYLKYNKSSASGLVSKTAQMLSEMSQFGIRPGNFTEPPVSAKAKYQDLTKLLILLYDLYGEDCIDESMLFSEVASGLDTELVGKLFPGLKKIYINGYGIYTPPMIGIIKKLADRYNISIKLEYDPVNESLFSHTYNAFDALKPLASKITTRGNGKSDIHKFLFNAAGPDKNQERYKDEFIIRSLPSREDEVKYIAGTIRDLYRKKDMPLHRIAVTFPNLEKYAPLIRKTFSEFEIPYNLSTGFKMSQSPLVQAYLQVLTLRMSNFETGAMSKLLTSPFLSPEYRVNINQYHKIVKETQIRRFSGNWRDRLMSGDAERSDIISEIGEKIAQICEIVSHLDSASTPNDYPVVFLNTLDRLGMMQWFKREENDLSRSAKEREFRAYNRFYKLLNQITLTQTIENISLRDFSNILQLVIRDATYNLKEWSDYGVQCMPRLEVQSLESEILFVGGLVEGEFPRALQRDIFFNDHERNQMGLYAVEDLLAQDRFLFYQLLASPAKQKFLLYPLYEDDAGLLPSSFIRNLQTVTSVETIEDNSPDDFFLNRTNLPEYLAGKIRTEFSTADIQKIPGWFSIIKPENVKFILDVINESYIKNSRSGFSAFEGNLSANNFILTYLDEKIKKSIFSITALELYAFCPMKYFLQRILNLPDEEEEEEAFNAMERGALIHQILFEFFTGLKRENRLNEPWRHRDLLVEIAENLLNKLPYEGIAWTLEKENILGSTNQKGLLQKFLEVEQNEITEYPYHPIYFELAFGLQKSTGDSDQHSVKNPLQIQWGSEIIKLSGKIDRIDSDNENKVFIIDYKTGKGKNATIRDMYEGTSLQLPVYMAAIQQLMKKCKPVAGIYYQIHDADNCQRIVAVSDSEAEPGLLKKGHGRLPNKSYPLKLNALSEIAINHILHHIDSMLKGCFNHTKYPVSEACQSYCTFRRICRKDVAKLRTIAENDEN